MPNLAAVQAIASDTPPRTVMLSGMSITVLFSALDACNRLYDWQGAGFGLDPAEIDLIDEILGDARHELMVGMIGQVIMSAGNNAPYGTLICDGATYERTDYPDLYAILPGIFIVDGDHFKVPDLRETFPYGSSSTISIGDTGGEASVTLSESQIPAHVHGIGGAGTSIAAPGAVPVLTPSILPGTTGATGGDAAHNNIPPYLALAFYIVAV